MSSEDRIQQAFVDVGMVRGGEFYVPATAAGRYTDACVLESLAIVGVECFRFEEGSLKPDLSQIADFSMMFTSGNMNWNLLIQATAAEAQRFLRQIPAGHDVRLTFTLLGEEESSSWRADS